MARFSAWPAPARSLADIPEPLGAELGQQLAVGERPEHLVYVPADATAARRGPWARTRGVQVLALTDRRILLGVQAAPADEPRWLACAYDEIVAWELSQNLLYGHLDLYGPPASQPSHAWMEFNTVGLRLIEAALAPLERATLGLERSVSPAVLPAAVQEALPYHFASYLRHALLPGEIVQEWLLQAAILESVLRFWKRMVAPPTLIVSTPVRLLVLREEPVTRKARYGHRSLTLPRSQAGALTLRDEAPWLLMAYGPAPSTLQMRLDPGHRPVAARMLAALAGMS
ncbi:MAG: hypothetical protein HXY37_01110 [Chloroflexi bacterium]|nr:hypothetical protein [Chloroflexota bacterium]